MTERIESFRELKVYRAAFELQQEIFEVTGALMVWDLSSHEARSTKHDARRTTHEERNV